MLVGLQSTVVVVVEAVLVLVVSYSSFIYRFLFVLFLLPFLLLRKEVWCNTCSKRTDDFINGQLLSVSDFSCAKSVLLLVTAAICSQ